MSASSSSSSNSGSHLNITLFDVRRLLVTVRAMSSFIASSESFDDFDGGMKVIEVTNSSSSRSYSYEEQLHFSSTINNSNLSCQLSQSNAVTDATTVDAACEELAAMLELWESWELVLMVTLITRVVPILFSLITVCALVGNTAVVCVIVRRKEMRTPLNLFLLNLAVSDVTFASVGLPFVTYRFVAETWALGGALCSLHNYVIMTTIHVSVYTMVAVAAFRCYYVTNRKSMQSDGSAVRYAVVCILVIWIVMLIANIPSLYLHKVKAYQDYLYCGVDNSRQLFTSFFVFGYALPLSLAIFSYAAVAIHLRRKQNTGVGRATPPSSTTAAGRARLRNRRAMRLLIVVITTFTFCWLPLHIQLLLAASGVTYENFVMELFRILAMCLAYCSTVVNPIIYNFVSPEFRYNFILLFKSIACKR